MGFFFGCVFYKIVLCVFYDNFNPSTICTNKQTFSHWCTKPLCIFVIKCSKEFWRLISFLLDWGHFFQPEAGGLLLLDHHWVSASSETEPEMDKWFGVICCIMSSLVNNEKLNRWLSKWVQVETWFKNILWPIFILYPLSWKSTHYSMETPTLTLFHISYIWTWGQTAEYRNRFLLQITYLVWSSCVQSYLFYKVKVFAPSFIP